ncbi:flagellar biosynthetic protein FliO [Colwellia sp. E150_009]|jgi:flagellar protein FliO/FliZ
MAKISAFIACCFFGLLMPYGVAQSSHTLVTEQTPQVTEQAPQVGKHVMANMNASSMILSLLMVLGLIIICALVLKRFNFTQQNSAQLKVIASLSLGAKERIIVVQVGEEQLVLGVSPQKISLLKNLETPIDVQLDKPMALSKNVLSFLQKNSKTQIDNNTTSKTTKNT